MIGLIQFNDDDPKFVYVHFNADCFEADRKSMLQSLEKKAIELGMQIIETSKFTMKQKEGVDEIELETLSAFVYGKYLGILYVFIVPEFVEFEKVLFWKY